MKRCTALLICFLSAALTPTAFADEGMWLLPNLTPSIVKRLDRLEFMRVSDLANANEPSFKDAVVKLSTGCTGSIVSRSGIVLTNHHCISNALQQIGKTSPALTNDGFYAATLADEVHVEGMTVALPLAMLDITGLVRNGVSPNASIEEQQAQIGNTRGLKPTSPPSSRRIATRSSPSEFSATFGSSWRLPLTSENLAAILTTGNTLAKPAISHSYGSTPMQATNPPTSRHKINPTNLRNSSPSLRMDTKRKTSRSSWDTPP